MSALMLLMYLSKYGHKQTCLCYDESKVFSFIWVQLHTSSTYLLTYINYTQNTGNILYFGSSNQFVACSHNDTKQKASIVVFGLLYSN